MFVLLNNRIFVKENIKQIFLDLGNIFIIYREEYEGKVCDRKEKLKENGTLEDIKNMFNSLDNPFPDSDNDKNRIYPNSKKCIHLKIEKGAFDKDSIYKKCSVCADKLCSNVFGSDMCFYHYKEEEE